MQSWCALYAAGISLICREAVTKSTCPSCLWCLHITGGSRERIFPNHHHFTPEKSFKPKSPNDCFLSEWFIQYLLSTCFLPDRWRLQFHKDTKSKTMIPALKTFTIQWQKQGTFLWNRGWDMVSKLCISELSSLCLPWSLWLYLLWIWTPQTETDFDKNLVRSRLEL